MYLAQKIILSIFGIGLAFVVIVGIRVLYAGESIPVIALRHPNGTEFILYLRDGALMIWRIVGNGLWMVLAALVVFVWATPLKKKHAAL